MSETKSLDPEVVELQRQLDACKADRKGLRARLRRGVEALLGRMRRDDFADSTPEDFPGTHPPFDSELPK